MNIRFGSWSAARTAIVSALALTVALALHANVIAQQRTEHEVLFGRKLVERTGDHQPYGLETLVTSEEQVDSVCSGRLKDVWDMLPLKSLDGICSIAAVKRVENQLTNTFLIFVDVIVEHFHFYRLL